MTESAAESTVLEKNMELLQIAEGMIDKELNLEMKSDAVSPSTSTSTGWPHTTNRRYSLRPTKQKESTNQFKASSPKKKLSCFPEKMALETIFENPICKNGSIKLLGKKLKRFISFNNFVTKTKLNHRKSKIKRLSSKLKRKKLVSTLTIEELKKRLESLEETEDSGEWMDIVE